MSEERIQASEERRDRGGDYPRLRRFTRRDVQKSKDHLRLLAIFYYIMAPLIALVGSFPLIHVGIGVAMVSGAMGRPPQGPPPELGFVFIAIGSTIVLFSWTLAGCIFFAGRSLAAQKRYVFCFVIACLLCLNVPLGVILGVFTIIVLVQESTKELFEHGAAAFASDEEYD